jgi:hypothetical protein
LQFGRTPIEFAASEGRRDMVEMLFPLTSPIPTLPEWSIDGIISHVESFGLKPRACVSFYPHLQLHIVFISMDYYHNCYYPAVLPVIQRRNSFNLVLSQSQMYKQSMQCKFYFSPLASLLAKFQSLGMTA